MAHFAELDATNTVLRVIVVNNDVITIDGVEDEQRGIDFLDDLFPGTGSLHAGTGIEQDGNTSSLQAVGD